jgi:hypothetical protein
MVTRAAEAHLIPQTAPTMPNLHNRVISSMNAASAIFMYIGTQIPYPFV